MKNPMLTNTLLKDGCRRSNFSLLVRSTSGKDFLKQIEGYRRNLFTVNQSRLNALSELQAARKRIADLGQHASGSHAWTLALTLYSQLCLVFKSCCLSLGGDAYSLLCIF